MMNILVATNFEKRKKMGEINFNNLFYLIYYIQNISTYKQFKIMKELFILKR